MAGPCGKKSGVRKRKKKNVIVLHDRHPRKGKNTKRADNFGYKISEYSERQHIIHGEYTNNVVYEFKIQRKRDGAMSKMIY